MYKIFGQAVSVLLKGRTPVSCFIRLQYRFSRLGNDTKNVLSTPLLLSSEASEESQSRRSVTSTLSYIFGCTSELPARDLTLSSVSTYEIRGRSSICCHESPLCIAAVTNRGQASRHSVATKEAVSNSPRPKRSRGFLHT